jgi:hypothetical protein
MLDADLTDHRTPWTNQGRHAVGSSWPQGHPLDAPEDHTEPTEYERGYADGAAAEAQVFVDPLIALLRRVAKCPTAYRGLNSNSGRYAAKEMPLDLLTDIAKVLG